MRLSQSTISKYDKYRNEFSNKKEKPVSYVNWYMSIKDKKFVRDLSKFLIKDVGFCEICSEDLYKKIAYHAYM